MSDAPTNQFLIEFGIDEMSTRDLTHRVTQIIAKNIKISDESGSDVLRCELDKSACVRDIVRFIDREDLTPVDAQWMFFVFGVIITNEGWLQEISQTEHAARRLLATPNAAMATLNKEE